MKKRILCLLLVLGLLLSALPMTVFAAADAKPEKITLVGSDEALSYEKTGTLEYSFEDIPVYTVSVPFGTTSVSLYDSGVYLGMYGSGYVKESELYNGDDWADIDSVGTSSPYTIETRLDGTGKNLSFVKHGMSVNSNADGYFLKFVGAGEPSAAPTITTDLSATKVSYTWGDTATALSVTATGSGTLSYQWQVSTTSATEGFADISNATSAACTPATDKTGDFWYRVEVTNQEDGKSKTKTVSAATPVSVLAPEGKTEVHIQTPVGYTANRPITFTLKNASGTEVPLTKDTSTGYAVYDFFAEPGEYTYTATETKDSTTYTLGTGTLTFESGKTNSFSFGLVYVYTNISGFTAADFTTEVKDTAGTVMTPGEPYKFAAYVAYPYFMAPGSYTYQIKVTEASAAKGYQDSAVTGKTLTAGKYNSTWSLKLDQLLAVSITVPKGAKLALSESGTAITPTASTTSGENDVYTFSLKSGSSYLYRASGVGRTTVNRFTASSSTKSIDLTAMKDRSAAEIIRTEDERGTQNADLRITGVNYTGLLEVCDGDPEQITPQRMWQIVDSTSVNTPNANVLEPDFHYTVVDENGQPSDLVSVSDTGLITAKEGANGIAYVLVTYDAIDVGKWANSTTWNYNTTFGAIWPENTGVVVVAVNNSVKDIDQEKVEFLIHEDNADNKKVTKKDSMDELDAELDVLYYTSGSGYEYTFTLDDDDGEMEFSVSVLKPVITESGMTYKGYTNLTQNADGSWTAILPEGKNVIRVYEENDEEYTYQVISVKKASYTVENAAGADKAITPGSTVRITLSGVYNPVNFMTGMYGVNPRVDYTAPDGTTVSSTALTQNSENWGYVAYWNFDGTKGIAARTIEVTIPEDAKIGEDYVLTNGRFTAMGGNFAALGTHHEKTKAYTASSASLSNQSGSDVRLGALPDIVIPVDEKVRVAVNAELKSESGSLLSGYKVIYTSGEETITAEDGKTAYLSYGTWEYTFHKSGYLAVGGTLTVTADSVAPLKVSQTAKAATLTNSWDGLTATVPTTKDGVYQISSAAELKWFADAVNSGEGTTYQAALTADIDLSGHEWTPIGSAKNPFSGTFDGQEHKIYNLRITLSEGETSGYDDDGRRTKYVGLFGCVKGSSGSHVAISNLTLASGSVSVTGKASASYSDGVNSIGAIVGGVMGGYVTIENCVNYADVSVVTASIYAEAGGIVGTLGTYVGDKELVLRGCGNYGSICGDSADENLRAYGYGGRVGGIVGDTVGTARISECYNCGKVTSYGAAGGILGGSNGGSGTSLTLRNLYNTGAISGGDYVGGIAGLISGSGMENAYSATTPEKTAGAKEDSKTGGIVGVRGAALTNVYYPDGSAAASGDAAKETDTATAMTATQLKALTGVELGSAFMVDAKNVNGGYPILVAQTKITDFTITSLPTKTSYVVRDTIDLTGIAATAKIDGVTTELDASMLTASPKTLKTVGQQTITVTFGTQSATFDVDVRALSASDISLSTTLIDGQSRKGSRMTFEVTARFAANNEKVASGDVLVSISGDASVAVNWDDSNKTSYTVIFSGESGDYTITVSVLGVKTERYVIHYTKAAPGEKIGEIVCSLEAFTLGGGYILEPQLVDIYEGENGAVMLDRLLTENGFTYRNTGSIGSGFYLSSITHESLAAIPADGSAIPQILKDKLGSGLHGRTDEETLGEFDYASGSGWMISVNNVFTNVGFSDIYPTDGDVLRAQFTLALGADLGGGYSAGGGVTTDWYPTANKGVLTTLLAKREMVGVTQAVLDVVTKVNATQAEVDAAVEDLRAADAVDSKIAAIGTVTLESRAAIDEARAAYDALTDARKALVSKYETLQDAEAEYDRLAEQAAADKAAADAVAEKIAAIGTVTKDSGTELAEIRAAYDALTDAQKALVGNLAVLEKAEEDYEELTKPIPSTPVVPVTPSSPSKNDKKEENKNDEVEIPVYTDVARGDWYYQSVQYVVGKGLMKGTSTTQFSPNATLSRAMLVTILYRLAGEPEVGGKCSAEDVSPDAWYAKAVTWAMENDIVKGYSDTRFAPDESITREQLACLLFRYAQYCGQDTKDSASLAGFADAARVSVWSAEAVRWAVARKLISGRADGTLDPTGTATRAEAAAILTRFCTAE